ncbi:lysophospholipid acyltransferase family protein [Desulfolutivibrio sulfoxidireducens]|uniref:lysophospholipid acyltransferase family protein n=1 Tax=Desulfolutivibrio sulfoxidireducens TaxID=2773299 RepID=UPI00159DC430|nr:GNAT family N-acyltransferase [Desulfolutivibrio sulfoxidireducens]QLA18594.1 GNAT family N-acetyltransferase [Desulfolutivibrio sulfoxidireducens]
MADTQREPLFEIRLPETVNPVLRGLLCALYPPLRRILSLASIEERYATVPRETTGRPFINAIMEAFDFSYQVSEEDLARIPASGPVVVVANHPFGGIEGLILAGLLSSVRPDVKIMANFLLKRIPELAEFFIFVDPFGSDASAKKNIRPLKQCLAHLRQGGIMGVFPAGEVSHLQFKNRRPSISDPAWSASVARIVRKTGATVVPMFFNGANSRLFQLLGLMHPVLRTALLPREFFNKGKKPIEVRIGSPIPFAKLDQLCEGEDDADELVIRYLRLRSYLLGTRAAKPRRRAKLFPPKAPARQEALIAAVNPKLMADEIAKLPPERLMCKSGEFSVICAEAAEIPLTLREIGRLRELTFRKVGEGSGKACDLDGFDPYYLHLFLWNETTREVAGAYRIGRTDEIHSRKGQRGLYTDTLFVLKDRFLERIGPALEMGRSFVRPEYQKSYSPLLLLWKGLAQLVVKNPKYKVLFGPVSITNEYKTASRQLIARYFKEQNALPELARLVRPRTPLKEQHWLKNAARTLVTDLDDLVELLADIESDQKGIPVLLRQYLKLGGKLLAFNVDHEFSDSLDGLIVVDLLRTDRKQLERYMGKKGLAEFLGYHGLIGQEGRDGSGHDGTDGRGGQGGGFKRCA